MYKKLEPIYPTEKNKKETGKIARLFKRIIDFLDIEKKIENYDIYNIAIILPIYLCILALILLLMYFSLEKIVNWYLISSVVGVYATVAVIFTIYFILIFNKYHEKSKNEFILDLKNFSIENKTNIFSVIIILITILPFVLNNYQKNKNMIIALNIINNKNYDLAKNIQDSKNDAVFLNNFSLSFYSDNFDFITKFYPKDKINSLSNSLWRMESINNLNNRMNDIEISTINIILPNQKLNADNRKQRDGEQRKILVNELIGEDGLSGYLSNIIKYEIMSYSFFIPLNFNNKR